VSINNDALATVENTKPSFDLELRFKKIQTSCGMPQQAYVLGIEYRSQVLVDRNQYYLADNVILIFRQQERILILPADFLSRSYRRTSEELLSQEKIDPVVCLIL
jgi:hypothetical protein